MSNLLNSETILYLYMVNWHCLLNSQDYFLQFCQGVELGTPASCQHLGNSQENTPIFLQSHTDAIAS